MCISQGMPIFRCFLAHFMLCDKKQKLADSQTKLNLRLYKIQSKNRLDVIYYFCLPIELDISVLKLEQKMKNTRYYGIRCR